jgi:hypothetical protein
MRIILTPPTADTPGFNYRSFMAIKFQEAAQSGTLTAVMYREFVEFLCDFVSVEFADKEPVISKFDALFKHATENQMKELMAAVGGGGAEAQVPPVKSAPSGTS